MDISNNYIFMCKYAGELRNTWIWREGDYYAGTVHNCKEVTYPYGTVYGGICSDDYEPNYIGNCGHGWYSEVWPLPRIDQLQSLTEAHTVIDWERFYLYIAQAPWCIRCDTAEKAGLKLLMKKAFDRNWTGGHWE